MRPLQFLIISTYFLLCGCVQKKKKRFPEDYTVDIYKEQVIHLDDVITYCDTCMTKYDVYQYEMARGSQPIYNKQITLQELQQVFGGGSFNSKRVFGNLEGPLVSWTTALIFVQVDTSKTYKTIHAYDYDDDLINNYAAKVYFNDPLVDKYIDEYTIAKIDFKIIKAIYKNMKEKLDKKYGLSIETNDDIIDHYNNPVIKEFRRVSWYSKGFLDSWSGYEVGGSTIFLEIRPKMFYSSTSSSYTRPIRTREDEFWRDLGYNDLYLDFRNGGFNSVIDSIYNSWSLKEKKRRLSKKGFDDYIDMVLSYTERLEKHSDKSVEEITKTYIEQPIYRDLIKLRDSVKYKELLEIQYNKPPEGYIEPLLLDENDK